MHVIPKQKKEHLAEGALGKPTWLWITVAIAILWIAAFGLLLWFIHGERHVTSPCDAGVKCENVDELSVWRDRLRQSSPSISGTVSSTLGIRWKFYRVSLSSFENDNQDGQSITATFTARLTANTTASPYSNMCVVVQLASQKSMPMECSSSLSRFDLCGSEDMLVAVHLQEYTNRPLAQDAPFTLDFDLEQHADDQCSPSTNVWFWIILAFAIVGFLVILVVLGVVVRHRLLHRRYDVIDGEMHEGVPLIHHDHNKV